LSSRQFLSWSTNYLISCTPKVHCLSHNRSPLVSIMHQMFPLHNLPFYLFKMHFMLPYHLHLGLPRDLSSSLLSTIVCIQVSVLSMCATCPAHLILPTYQYPVITTNNTSQQITTTSVLHICMSPDDSLTLLHVSAATQNQADPPAGSTASCFPLDKFQATNRTIRVRFLAEATGLSVRQIFHTGSGAA